MASERKVEGAWLSRDQMKVTWSHRGLSFHPDLVQGFVCVGCHVPWWTDQWSVETFITLRVIFSVLSHFQRLVQLLAFVEVIEIRNDDRNRECNCQHAWNCADWAHNLTSKGFRCHVTVTGKGNIIKKIATVFLLFPRFVIPIGVTVVLNNLMNFIR